MKLANTQKKHQRPALPAVQDRNPTLAKQDVWGVVLANLPPTLAAICVQRGHTEQQLTVHSAPPVLLANTRQSQGRPQQTPVKTAMLDRLAVQELQSVQDVMQGRTRLPWGKARALHAQKGLTVSTQEARPALHVARDTFLHLLEGPPLLFVRHAQQESIRAQPQQKPVPPVLLGSTQ